MLVISRREGEAFQIGPDVWVTIVAIRGSQVRVGIQAPAEMKILRDDVRGYQEPTMEDEA